MTGTRKDRIEAAAVVFAYFTKEKDRIASIFDITPTSLNLWIKTDEFHAKLEALGYTGDRLLLLQKRRDVQRDTREDYEKAEAAYQESVAEGIPKHKRIDFVAKQTGLKKRRLRGWRQRFGWDQEDGIDIGIGDIGYP